MNIIDKIILTKVLVRSIDSYIEENNKLISLGCSVHNEQIEINKNIIIGLEKTLANILE